MEEQTLDVAVYVPAVAEALATLLTENNFASDADQVRDSFTPTALTDYCHAFIQSRVAPRVGLSTFQRAKNFLRFIAEDNLIKKMKDTLAEHDVELEYFKTKVINSLARMESVGKIVVERSHELLSPYVDSSDFITHISQIINEHAQDDESKPVLEDVVRQLAERFKPELLAVEEKKDGEVAAEPSIFDRIMRKFIKRELTEEEELRILQPIYDQKAVFQLRSEPIVTAKMDIDYAETVRVEILPARPQDVPLVEKSSVVEEIPAAPLLDRVFSVFRKKKGEEQHVVEVVPEKAEVVAPPQADIIVTNNGGPSLLSRLTSFTTTVSSAVGTAVESAVSSFVAPKSAGIRFSSNEDAFIRGETTRRELLERMEKLDNEVKVGTDFLASAIEEHSNHLDALVSYKLKVLSQDITIGQEKDIQQKVITQLSFYEPARDDNDVKKKDAAVKNAAVRWWNVGILKHLPILSYFYKKLKERTVDYFESALACEEIKMQLQLNRKDEFNGSAEKYRTHFGEYIGDRFKTFFERNEERNAAGDVLGKLEAEWKEKYGEVPYRTKPLDLDLSVRLVAPSAAVIAQASEDWGDLAEVAPPTRGSPTLARGIN